MKILCALPTYRGADYGGSLGGGEISNQLLLEGLASRGHEVMVVTAFGPARAATCRNGVNVRDVSRERAGARVPRWIARLSYHRAVIGAACEDRFDVILAGTEAVPAALAAGREQGVPVAVLVRAFEHFPWRSGIAPTFPGLVRRRIKQALYGDFGVASLCRAHHLIASSRFLARECREQVPDVSASVVYPPLDRAVLPTRAVNAVRTVVMVGTGRHKGDSIIRRLARDCPDIRFRVVGCQELGPSQRRVESNITFIGWCDTRYEFEHEADVVIVPSLWREPFGRVAIEALAAGAIVLASDTGGLPEALNDQRPLLVDAGCEEAWSRRFQDLRSNPERYREASLRANGALDRFTNGAPVTALEHALTEVGIRYRGSSGASHCR